MRKNMYKRSFLLWRYLKGNWHILINLILAIVVVVIAVYQYGINRTQLQISKDQKAISEQQLSLSVKQDDLIRAQAILAEKQLNLSSYLGHQHVNPKLNCWMDFPEKGQFYVWIANRSPINVVSLSVEYYDLVFNARDEVQMIGSGRGDDPRYFFFKAQLMPGEKIRVDLGNERSTWRYKSDETLPDEFRLVRLFYIIKLTYYRDTDLRRFSKTFVFQTDLKTFHSKRIEVFEKHPDYRKIKAWLDEATTYIPSSPELSGESK